MSPSVSVLVIEDLKVAQIAAINVFKQLNCSIVISPNAATALEKIITNHFDIIFVDINLPDINGFEIARTIRSVERSRRLPIIALTADIAGPERFKEAGMDDYLLKPITMDSAEHMLRKHVSSRYRNAS